jgi:hypothetical protein
MDKHRKRNPDKHEYEVQAGSSHTSVMVFVGNTEKTAIKRGSDLAAEHGEEQVRLYHTHPSPGPVRRYVGVIRGGVLHRA